MSLLSAEELAACHEKFHAENPDKPRGQCPQCKLDRQRESDNAAKFVCQCAREDKTLTIKELAYAVSRRPAWVRAVLQENGLSAPEAPRPVLLPKGKRPCAICGHVRCHHCRGTSPRKHINPGLGGAYPCPRTPHCKDLIEVSAGQFTNCSCVHYSSRRSG
jgi:hypothetical protein